MSSHIVPVSERKRLVAQALRDMASRLESSRVCAYRMQSIVEVMYPSITQLPDGDVAVDQEWLSSPRSHWEGIVEVVLPDGTLGEDSE